MGSSGLSVASKPVKYFPVGGASSVADYEEKNWTEGFGRKGKEKAVLFTNSGEPIVGIYGRSSGGMSVPGRYLQDGNILSHTHPDKNFGGTLSLTDLKTFAKTGLSEIRASDYQGYTYSVKAGPNADKDRLSKWVNSKSAILLKNFRNNYSKSIKRATTPLKSGPNKGKVKLPNANGTGYVYRNPMSKEQAVAYARKSSVNTFDKAYKNALQTMGFTYTVTKIKK